MIAEVFPTYDASGRPVLRPSRRRYGNLGPNAPLGRHVTQPLSVLCADLEDMRRFLQGCRYVSDQVQFGRRDYWMPPEEFERRRQGDCDDFALWTWRQLMQLGYSARFVVGHGGRYGAGHAWVTFERDGRTFIVESLAARLGPSFPRLSTLQYKPRLSASWDGRALKYYEHTLPTGEEPFLALAPHIPEWVSFRVRSYSMFIFAWLRFLTRVRGHRPREDRRS